MEGFMDNYFSGYHDSLKVLDFVRRIDDEGSTYVDFSSYSPCYKFSNENLVGYYDKFDNKGRVLTVCGSGDQVLSSILYGAKEIDCFDSNRVAYYNLMLKIYAIKSLDYNCFIDFFGISSTNVDKKNIYDSFKHRIDNKSIRVFFDILFDASYPISYLYNKDEEDVNDLFCNIPYLIPENYDRLKGMIDSCKINFKHSDLFNVFSFFDGKYDFINFSNIYDYVDSSIKFCTFIENVKSNHLEKNGAIMINYSWSRPHFSSSVDETASFIGAYQLPIPSCHDSKIYSNSIMYYGNIKH